jgi:hypothetical protein
VPIVPDDMVQGLDSQAANGVRSNRSSQNPAASGAGVDGAGECMSMRYR